MANRDREDFHAACRRLLSDQGHRFTGLDLGRSPEGVFHRLSALTGEGVETHQVFVPERADTWDIGVARHLVAKFQHLAGADTWYAFECHNYTCHSKREGNGTGVCLDVRLPWESAGETTVPCPICQQPMTFRGCWAATESGHGSRGDGGLTPPEQA